MEISGKKLKLTIWDTAGQERFRTLTSSYYRGAQGIALVYDVSRRDTFEALSQWLKEVDIYTPGGGSSVVKLLVGNKIDKTDRAVSLAEADAWAREKGMIFLECSARTSVSIKQVFTELVQKILQKPELLRGTGVASRGAIKVDRGDDKKNENYEQCGC